MIKGNVWKRKKKEDRYTLYMVLAQSCCYLDGKAEEGFSYLQKIGGKKLICRNKIIYFLSCANYAFMQKDKERFQEVIDELERMSFDKTIKEWMTATLFEV